MRSIITTPTNKLEDSIDFYSKLGFKTISKNNQVMVTDGKVVIEINPDRFARAGLKFYKESWSKEIESLKKLVHVVKFSDGYLFNDLSGTRFYLIESAFDLSYQPQE